MSPTGSVSDAAVVPLDDEKKVPTNAETATMDGDKTSNHTADHVRVMDQFVSSAKAATEKEQKMTLREGVKLYPKAIAWSMLISTCIVMEGYDVCLINNFCE
jgi:MFS transporter, SP family, general alpha glucoside:H+ symporter